MEQVKLTAENAAKAETWLPLGLKCAVARVLAPGCVEQIGNNPPLYGENVVGRKLMERFVLAGYYLHLVDVSGLNEGVFSFTVEQYDALEGLEDRLEGDWGAAVRKDYGVFLGILDREIKNELARKNDALLRLGTLLSAGLTPALLGQLQEALKEADRA